MTSLPGMYLRKVIFQVIALNLGAAVITVFFQRTLQDDIERVTVEAWGMFFAVLGVIYAIIVGFVLAELLTRFHRLATQCRDELNAIEDVRDFLLYVDHNESEKDRIGEAVHAYIRSILEVEWHAMSNGLVNGDTDTSSELYKLMESVEALELHDTSDAIALEAIIQRLGQITTYRTERLEMSKSQLSPALRFLIVFMSFVVAAGFALMDIDSAVIHGFMVFAVVTAIFVLWLVISDLDRPFTGMWTISNDPFRRVAARLDATIDRVSTREVE